MRIVSILTIIFGFIAAIQGLLWCVDALTPASRATSADFHFYIASLGGGLVAILIGGCARIFVDMADQRDAEAFARLAADAHKPREF